MDTIPLLIDTDPGVDDALALLMAFNDTRHRVVGLTIAAGNVGLRHTVRNALKLCEVAGVDAPVYAGCPGPLLHPAPDAGYVHGEDGRTFAVVVLGNFTDAHRGLGQELEEAVIEWVQASSTSPAK